MNEVEQKIWSDVVKVTNRTDTTLEWLWDSVLYILKAGESKFLPRHICMAGIRNYPVSVNPFSGLVDSSLIGIDEPNTKYPVTPLNINVKELAEQPKSEDSTAFVAGNIVKKKVISLAEHRENFQANNM